MNEKPIFVAGATGYVGGRLVPMLLEDGYRVRALARSPAKIRGRPWGGHPLLEVVRGDVLDASTLSAAAGGCGAGYYLVHSMMAQQKRFVEADRRAARNMAAAAASGGLEKVIYLGGLGDVTEAFTSKHLHSRHEVGEILGEGPVPCTTLRAAMILGSGSASFEILRYLVERLPVMTTPQWVLSPNQPIAISNVLHYLKGCLESQDTLGQTLDIGGPDVLSYRELIDIYAEEAGLPKRWVIPVPVLTPTLSSYWIHLVTPVPAAIARPLTEGLTSAAVCREYRIREIIPQRLLTCREAIRVALERVRRQRVETCWKDAGRLLPAEWAYCGDAKYAGGTILEDGYRVVLAAPTEAVWTPIARIGGDTGWYFGDRVWKLRAMADRLAGGTGLRRGRPPPEALGIGDTVDFWRVLDVRPPHRLVLQSDMKLPGEALLEFDVRAVAERQTEFRLRSRFFPKGIGGILYWHALAFFHRRMLRGLTGGIAAAVGEPILAGPLPDTESWEDACNPGASR